MKARRGLLGAVGFLAFSVSASAQTPPPLLGSIEAPYLPLQSAVTIGGTNWAGGLTAYGPQGTPLVIYGSNLGGDGVVQFIAYKNGAVDTSVGTNGIFNATVTLWTSNMLITTVPSGAYSGLVKVLVEGQYSNALPFLVTGGVYAGTCPAGPTSTQLQITTTALADGQVGNAYSASLYSSGGTGNITWSIASGTLPSGLTLNQPSGSNPATITGTPTATTGTNPAALTFKAADSASPQDTDEAEITLTVNAQSMSQGSVYTYNVTYDYAGNVTWFGDATYGGIPGRADTGIMGAWSMTSPGGGEGYDNLNRLTNATVAWPDGTTQYFCWQYDAYGNRLEQEFSSAQFQSGSGGASACTPQSSATLATDISSYGTNNWVTSTNARGVSATPNYDLAGDLESDGANTYLYDGEGRVCAVSSTLAPGTTTMTGYLYDADGNRVAKGSISTMSCNPATNGFQFTEDYVTGPGGEELSMLNGSGTWQRTNVYGGGKLIGTYDLVHNPAYTPNGSQPAQVPWLHLHLEDALGTRRMQVSGMLANLGQPEMDFQSLPYGDGFSQFQDQYADETYDDSSPLHFTGKERDTESGNDYFDARYYSSSMGRFMSPDWSAKEEPVPYAKLDNPQSLNLYSYVLNNPVTAFDNDGHEIIFAANATQVMRDSVQAILANPNTSSNLSGYVGPNNPNLTIQSGDLTSMDSHTLTPDGAPGGSITQGVTEPDIQTSTSSSTDSNGVTTTGPPETTLIGATITIDNRTSAGDTPGVMVHETVHAGEARANPAQYNKDAKAEHANPCHNCRPQEQRANAAQKKYGSEIKKAVKQIEKDRKKEKQ